MWTSKAKCLSLPAALVAAILTLVLVFQGTSASINCQCHLKNSPLTTLGIACRNEASDTPHCRKDVRPSIPAGYRYIPGFGLIKLHSLSKSFEAAQKTCEREGGRLAIPRNEAMGIALTKFFPPDSTLYFGWLGINDIASTGYYQGVDGELAPWLNWQPNEPNHYGGVEHCVHFGNQNNMNDFPCDSPSPFFCERKLKAPLPLGYQFIEGHGFYKVHKEKMAYHKAEAKCREVGANLAVPETESEAVALNLVLRTFRDLEDVWIGISDDVDEGHFVTVHGTPMEDLEFSNWRDSEPNNDNNGLEDCVALHPSGVLNDATCAHPYSFVCELQI